MTMTIPMTPSKQHKGTMIETPYLWSLLIWFTLKPSITLNFCDRSFETSGDFQSLIMTDYLELLWQTFAPVGFWRRALVARINWNNFTVLCFTIFSSSTVSLIFPWTRWANANSRNSTGWVEWCWHPDWSQGRPLKVEPKPTLVRFVSFLCKNFIHTIWSSISHWTRQHFIAIPTHQVQQVNCSCTGKNASLKEGDLWTRDFIIRKLQSNLQG